MQKNFHKKTGVLFIFLLISIVTVFADGEIVFFEGNVAITRSGKEYKASSLYIGFELGNYDMVKTGANGKAELLLRTKQGQEVTIKVTSNSSFYIEMDKLKNGKEATSLDMLSGSVAVKVNTLTRNSEVQVRTRTTVMGVRGTNFSVESTANDDLLITCDEGKVTCTDEDGKVLFSEPGKVVEKIPGESFKSVNVDLKQLEEYKKKWLKNRLEVLKANALRATRFFAKIFLESYQNIADTYAELAKKKEIIQKWMDEDSQGKIGTKIEIMREKKQLVGLLFKLKRNLFLFEKAFFRLMELESYYQEGYGKGDIKPGLSAEEFFKNFDSKKDNIIAMITRLKYLFQLFAKRNDGYFPVDMLDAGDF